MIRLRYGSRIPCRGLLFKVSDAVNASTTARMFWGLYERAESRLVRRYLRQDLDVIELGSGIGVIASEIAMSRLVGGKLVLVEADPRVFALLTENVARHAPPQCSVSFVNAAVRAGERSTTGFTRGATHLTSRVVEDGMKTAATESVPAVGLRPLVEAHSLERYALVCDIEGAEAELILGGDVTSACGQLIIELHPTWYRGTFWTVERLIEAIELRCNMKLRDRMGGVCVFDSRAECGV